MRGKTQKEILIYLRNVDILHAEVYQFNVKVDERRLLLLFVQGSYPFILCMIQKAFIKNGFHRIEYKD